VGASNWNTNVAHDTVTQADASESMFLLSNVFRNRIKPEPHTRVLSKEMHTLATLRK